MKIIALLFIFSSMLYSTENAQEPCYMVSTKVKVHQGKVDEVLALFKKTNPALVNNQKDWIRAHFSADEEKSIVVVTAYWKSQKSYENFRKSDQFIKTMLDFQPYFVEKPEILITRVLFEM